MNKLKCMYRNLKYRLGLEDVNWETEALLLPLTEGVCNTEAMARFRGVESVTVVEYKTSYDVHEMLINVVGKAGNVSSDYVYSIPVALLRRAKVVPKVIKPKETNEGREAILQIALTSDSVERCKTMHRELECFVQRMSTCTLMSDGIGSWEITSDDIRAVQEANRLLAPLKKDAKITITYSRK